MIDEQLANDIHLIAVSLRGFQKKAFGMRYRDVLVALVYSDIGKLPGRYSGTPKEAIEKTIDSILGLHKKYFIEEVVKLNKMKS